MCEDHWFSPSVVSLPVGPILEVGKIVELRTSCIVVESITALFIEPTIHDLNVALTLVIAVVLESLLNLLLSSLGHSKIIGAVKLKIVPLVILSQILSSIVSARLVVVLLKSKFCELSHCSVRADEHKVFLIFGHVDIGTGILICSHITQRDHGDVISNLLTFDTTASWAIASSIEKEKRETQDQEEQEQIG